MWLYWLNISQTDRINNQKAREETGKRKRVSQNDIKTLELKYINTRNVLRGVPNQRYKILPVISLGPREDRKEMYEYRGWKIPVTGIIKHLMIYFGHHLTGTILPIWYQTSETDRNSTESNVRRIHTYTM